MNLPRNVAINFLSWLLPLGATIVFTKTIVHGLGAEGYGIYSLVTGFIAYSFYFAISRAIPVYVAEYRVKNKIEKIGEVVSATLLINLCVGLSALVFFLVATNWLMTSILQIPPEHQREARLSFYLAGGALLFMMVSQVFNAIPQALHRFDIYSSIALVTTLLFQVGNVLLVIAGYDVVSLFVWNLILMFLNCAVYWFIAKRLLPESKLTLSFSRSLLADIIKYSGGVIAYQALGNSLLIFERSWLTRVGGLETVQYYTVPMMISLYIHTFISSLTLVIFPMATEANARQDKERLMKIYTRSLKFLNVLIVLPVITLCVCSRAFLTVWVSTSFAERSSTVLILLTISFGLVALGIVTVTLADGLGKPWFNALLLLSWIIIAVPMMIWLTPKMNVVGSAYGRFFSIVLTIPIYILLVERWIFGKCLWGFWAKGILILGFFGTIVGLMQRLLILKLSLNWLTLGLIVGLSILCFFLGLWFTPYFSIEDKDWLFRLLNRNQKIIEPTKLV